MPTPAELPSWRRVEPWAAALAVAWCALRFSRGLGPVPFYNSDCAVPILLMQGMGQGPFTLYYPRQDRFGMWPFLLGRLLHLATPEAYQVVLTLGLCSAAIPVSGLLGSPALGVVTLLLPFVLRSTVAGHMFQSGQPYLWQLVTVVWAWWALRSVLAARSRPARALALAGLLVVVTLAVWMNTLSLLLIGLLLVLEARRARTRLRGLVGPVLAVAVSALLEAGLRHRYNVFCKQAFGQSFVTGLRIDTGQLLSNAREVGVRLYREGGAVPLLLGTVLTLVPGRTRDQRFNQAAMLVLSVATLPALVAVRHFRMNEFSGRYFAFPAAWAIAAAVYGSLLLLSSLAGRRASWVRASALLAVVLTLPTGPADFLAPVRVGAKALAASGPSLLLADYWDVYVPASLAPAGVLFPVAAEGSKNRYPGSEAALQPGRTALLPCALEPPGGTVTQYGALLRRTPAPAIVASGFSWCPYRVERGATPGRPRPGH